MKKTLLTAFFAASIITAMLFLHPEHACAAFTTIGDISSAPVVQGDSILIHCSNADVRLKLCGHDIVKVWCDQSKKFTRTDPKWHGTGSFAVSNEKLGGPSSVTAADKGTYYEIATDALSIQCQKSPLRISFYDKSNGLICADNDANGMGWDDGSKELRCWKKKQSGENYFGLGQAVKGLNKTGKHVMNWNSDIAGGGDPLVSLGWSSEGNWYTSNPFFISTKGYGIFFDNTSLTRFDLGKENSQSIYFGTQSPCAAGDMIYYFIYGPNLKKVVTRYTDLTGKSFFPPRWALGCMQSHWGYHQGDIESVSGKYREKKIPCDAMIGDIDWYAGKCAPVAWHGGNFPNPKQMIQNLHNNGFKLLLISDPNISNNESACKEAYAAGEAGKHYVRNPSGGVSVIGWPWGGPSGLIDFFNEDAWKWWGKLHYPRMDEGVDGWWIDMNEPAKYNTDMNFYRSTNDHLGEIRELHNVFGLANSRADYLWMRDYFDNVAKNNKRPFLLSRAGYLGQQKYLTTWSGDTWREFAWLANQVFQAMSTGICGFPLFAHDIGGFWDGGHDQNLQTRWIEFGAFSPICRFHYAGSANEPWTSGTTAENVARKYIQLRYRLKPYLYSELAKSVVFGTGLPLCRALVLEYQDDATTYNQDSEYLFGPNMLVAPVVNSGTSRSVYLPKGTWIDYWDGTVYDGPKTISDYPAPLDKLPIFVKAGAIIPMYPLMNYEGEKPLDTLTFDVYPGGTSVDTLYEDQGETHEYQTGKYATTLLSCSGSMTDGPVNLVVGTAKGTYTGMPSTRTHVAIIHYQKKPDSVFLNQQKLGEVPDTAALSQASSGWCYLANDRKGTVRVKTAPMPASTPFAIAINGAATGVLQPGIAAEHSYDLVSGGNGIRIRFHSRGRNSINVYALNGKRIFSFSGNGPAGRRFVTETSGPGIYLAEIVTEGVTIYRRIVAK